MKTSFRLSLILAVGLGTFLFPGRAVAQGTVNFANKVPSARIDAPVTFQDGTFVSAGYTAQLYAGPQGSPASALQPVLPTSTFATGAAAGYIRPTQLEIFGLFPGEFATLQVRVYGGADWDNSLCRGESNLLLIQLSGGTSLPADLVGLQPFQVICAPEPSTELLFIAALALILSLPKHRAVLAGSASSS
jgi:hypothetical protein